MPDVQIAALQNVTVPLEYVLPGSVEFVLKAVNAEFTDNSAGGDWLPCVTILSDSGHVIARAVDQAVKVTAGDDAEVSWFPGVKHAASSAPVTGAISWGTSHGGLVASAAANASVDSTQTSVATNDAATFSLSAGAMLLKVAGFYLCSAVVYGTSNAIATTQDYEMVLNFDTPSFAESHLLVGGPWANTGRRTSTAGTFQWSFTQLWCENVQAAAAPVSLYTSLLAFQAAGATMACNSQIAAVRLSDPIAGSI